MKGGVSSHQFQGGLMNADQESYEAPRMIELGDFKQVTNGYSTSGAWDVFLLYKR